MQLVQLLAVEDGDLREVESESLSDENIREGEQGTVLYLALGSRQAGPDMQCY